MRVKIKKSVISEIGSQIKVKNSSGNFIGFAKFSTFGCKMIKKILNEYKKTNFKDYYTEVLNNLIEKKKVVNFVNVGQFYWKEIDTNKDYIKAKKIYKKIYKWWGMLVTLQLPLQCQCSALLLS